MKNFILMMTFLLTLPAFSKVKVKDIFFNISENGKFAWHLKYEGEMVRGPRLRQKIIYYRLNCSIQSSGPKLIK